MWKDRWLGLLCIHLFSFSFATNLKSLSNGIIEFSVDLDKGCALASLMDSVSKQNVINTFDLGREVQPSFYAGPDNYLNCSFSGDPWPWVSILYFF